MFWLLVLSTVFFMIGVIIFVLARDSFRASRAGGRESVSWPAAQKTGNAIHINTIMLEKLPYAPPSDPTTLFSGQCGMEADAFADTLLQIKRNPILPNEPKAYLRMEERDESLEHLLIRHVDQRKQKGHRNRQNTFQAAPQEFSIEVTEKR